MKRQKECDYFDQFLRMAEHSCKAAEMLQDILEHFDPDSLPDRMKDIHTIEHTADIVKHDTLRELARAFITPIEREDILLLIQEIDNVTDAVEDVVIRLYMFHVLSIREDALAFAKVILQCCVALRELLTDFRNFRKSTSLNDAITEINRLEEEGDGLYMQAVRRIYKTCQDPIQIGVWKEIFDRMEKCCDTCEHVANAVEGVVMKNT